LLKQSQEIKPILSQGYVMTQDPDGKEKPEIKPEPVRQNRRTKILRKQRKEFRGLRQLPGLI
jgi:hypothetical protein